MPEPSEPNPENGQPGGEDRDARIRVMLLFGGRSGEHGISCVTAAGVLSAIDRSKYDVVPVGIAKDGTWVPLDPDPQRWGVSGSALPQIEAGTSEVLPPQAVGSKELRLLADGAISDFGEVDVVFPLLHGPFGEDGTLQGALELLDVPYVGSGVLASALGMDKHFMKVAFAAASLPVGPYVAISDRDWRRDPALVEDAVASLGFPVFVKPARAGSSLGITKVSDPADLRAAIDEARRHDPKIVVEKEIRGREIECAVLDGRGTARPRASLPGEIVVSQGRHEFYDFDAKYLDHDAVVLSCPAQLPDKVIDEIQTMAVRAFEAIGAEGLSRVDFFVTERGNVIINEINTMPGFTPYSMYPVMWERTGIAYPDLIDELIQLALDRGRGLR